MEITGVILAGGASRRMGSDKALLLLDGRPSLAYCASALAEIAAPLLIACGPQRREAYEGLEVPQLTDRYPGLGPLSGLHAGLTAARTEWTAVLACDLPLVPGRLLSCMAELAASRPGLQAVVPVSREGRVQPLIGLYHRSVLPSLEEALEQRRLRVMDWLEQLPTVHYVRECDYPGDAAAYAAALLNMNTPEEAEAVRLRLAAHGGSRRG